MDLQISRNLSHQILGGEDVSNFKGTNCEGEGDGRHLLQDGCEFFRRTPTQSFLRRGRRGREGRREEGGEGGGGGGGRGQDKTRQDNNLF